jgi:hypothetical protein
VNGAICGRVTLYSRGFMNVKEIMSAIDEVSSLVLERKALDKKSAAIKAAEEDLKARIIQAMTLQGITVLNGTGGATAEVKTTIEPIVTDWPAFHGYVLSTGSLDFLHRRVTAAAVKLRWADGISIPGCDASEDHKLIIS